MLPGTHSRSLRTKIIIWSFVPTVIILAAVAWYIFYAYQRTTSELVLQQDKELAQVKATQASDALSEAVNPVISSLLFGTNFPALASETQRILLQQARDQLAVFDGGVVVLDRDGKVVITEPDRPEIQGEDWSDRAYFRETQAHPGQAILSNLLMDGPAGSPVVSLAFALSASNGVVNGAIVFMLRVDDAQSSHFYRILASQNLGVNIYIVDGNGMVVYHPDPTHLGADLIRERAVRTALTGQVGSLRTNDEVGRQIVVSFAPTMSPDWRLISVQDWVGLVRPILGYCQWLVLLISLGVIVPVLVVSVGVGRITKPINDLILAAQNVAGGNFDQRISADTGDEVETLAKQFNRMAQNLSESYALLEQRVADRTRDLAALNTVSSVVNQSLDLREILQSALSKTLEVMQMEAGAAYRLEADGHSLRMLCQCGLSEGYVRFSQSLARQKGMYEAYANTPTPDVWILPVSSFPQGELREHMEREGLNTVIGVPILSKGRLLGDMALGSRKPRSLSDEEASLLRSIGQQVGVAMENATLYERAEESAVAAERNRLARELHDAVTQTLFSTSLIAEVLPDLWAANPEEGRRRMAELRDLTRGALAEMRTLLLELRPTALTEASLSDLLHQLADALTGRARVPVRLEIEGVRKPPPEVQVVYYRVAQEAFNNISKYARAHQVVVRLHLDPGPLIMEIHDDGVGFKFQDVPSDHLGLGIMRERAESIGARLDITSRQGKGTRLKLIWPGTYHNGKEKT